MPRARKLRILSSDDDEEESHTKAASEPAPKRATTRSTRSTAGKNVKTKTAQNGSTDNVQTPVQSSITSSASRTSRSKPSKSKTASPRKSSSSRAASSSQSAAPISSFFSSAAQPNKRAKREDSVQLSEQLNENEEVDDIELSSDDQDEGKRRRRQIVPIISSEPDELPRKLPSSATSKPFSSSFGKVSRATITEDIDSRTWADKYAPSSTTSLAVHKRKIDDVRGWLNNMFERRSSKRLLVLSGPSGSGKTATITALSNEMGYDVLKWENPSRNDLGGDAIFQSLNEKFEEFMGRGTGYGTLELVTTSRLDQDDAAPKEVKEVKDPNRRRIVLLEDLPNIFGSSTAGSSAMMSFRAAIHTFLATPQDDSVPSPCILIVSENLTTQTNSTSITPHRLLGPQLLNHPRATSIQFNKIAPTIIQGALEKVVDVEARRMGIKDLPSPGLLAGIGACGDIRSAINTLEFIMVGKGNTTRQIQTLTKKPKKKGRNMQDWGEPNESEKLTLELVTQRESSLGIFHAVGKIVWNKRFDPSEPQILPPETLPDPPSELSNFARSPSLVDIKTLIDAAGVDLDTFVSGIHENYLSSCCGSSFTEHFEACVEHLSDSDILSYNVSPGGRNQVDDNLRQGELAFQVAVRGILMGLPAKVKRDSGKNSMYYPMSQRLWRDKEVVEGLISMFVSNGLHDFGNEKIPGGMADLDAILEYFPYTHKISKARTRNRGGLRTPAMKNLEKVVLFRGVGDQSEAVPDGPDEEEEVAEGEEDEMGNVKVRRKVRRQKEEAGQYGGRFKRRKDGGVGIVGVGDGEKGANGEVEEGLEALILAGDDIEDDAD